MSEEDLASITGRIWRLSSQQGAEVFGGCLQHIQTADGIREMGTDVTTARMKRRAELSALFSSLVPLNCLGQETFSWLRSGAIKLSCVKWHQLTAWGPQP